MLATGQADDIVLQMRRHGVTQDRVIARNQHIADGCAELWRYAEEMVQEAVNAGHLKPGAQIQN